MVSHLFLLRISSQLLPDHGSGSRKEPRNLHRAMRARISWGIFVGDPDFFRATMSDRTPGGPGPDDSSSELRERSRCVVGVLVPPSSPPPSIIPTTTPPRALERESSQVAPSSHDSHHRTRSSTPDCHRPGAGVGAVDLPGTGRGRRGRGWPSLAPRQFRCLWSFGIGLCFLTLSGRSAVSGTRLGIAASAAVALLTIGIGGHAVLLLMLLLRSAVGHSAHGSTTRGALAITATTATVAAAAATTAAAAARASV
jgi:hypothetical protein